MSPETVQPDTLAAAAGNLQGLNSKLAATNAAAAVPTAAVLPAAGDPISVMTARHFGAYAATYQSVFAQGAAAIDMFVRILGASAGSPMATEAAAGAEDE